MLTALNAAALTHIQTNAGVFLIGIDPADYTTVALFKAAITAAIGDDTKCLGATRGGGTFTITRETREVEADGKRFAFVGSTLVDNVDAYIKTTLIELTKGNLKRALGAADNATSGKVTTVTPRTEYASGDYIEKLCWVGDTADGLMAILLKNAINKADFELKISDKGEGEMSVEFHACQGDVNDYTTPPFAIYKIEN